MFYHRQERGGPAHHDEALAVPCGQEAEGDVAHEDAVDEEVEALQGRHVAAAAGRLGVVEGDAVRDGEAAIEQEHEAEDVPGLLVARFRVEGHLPQHIDYAPTRPADTCFFLVIPQQVVHEARKVLKVKVFVGFICTDFGRSSRLIKLACHHSMQVAVTDFDLWISSTDQQLNIS